MINYSSFGKLKEIFNVLSNQKIVDLFHNDKLRADNFSIQIDGLYVDFSKNLINKEVIANFIELAEELDLKDKIKDMFSGVKINFTENRAVLHSALRNPNLTQLNVDGVDVIKDINMEKQKFYNFVEDFNLGKIKGIDGKKITDIVNIGIGGSYLGTQMAYNALKSGAKNPINLHFVSNVDASNLVDVLDKVDPTCTLFVVASKTFTTQETMENAKTIKNWFLAQCEKKGLDGKKALQSHFIALSTNLAEVEKFGIKKEWIFGFWDFIGGRYSIWSSIGLPIALVLGVEKFKEFLDGAFVIDNNLQNENWLNNIPFMLAIIGIWHNNFFNYNSYAILPYDYRLRDFTRYVQQLEMESNGKYVNNQSLKVSYNTSPVVFGEPGSDSQHSFFQLLHQGTQIIPCDFIGFIKSNHGYQNHHDILIANLFAQSEALLSGKTYQEVKDELLNQKLDNQQIEKLAPHKVFEGNRPSNTLLFDELTPKTLGMLCAIYEHKIFIQGLFWEINSFDQWGVELGKKLANNILKEINTEIKSDANLTNLSSSCISLIKKYQQNR
jgi:glucose-6-phosphate isomerase